MRIQRSRDLQNEDVNTTDRNYVSNHKPRFELESEASFSSTVREALSDENLHETFVDTSKAQGFMHLLVVHEREDGSSVDFLIGFQVSGSFRLSWEELINDRNEELCVKFTHWQYIAHP